MAEFEITRSNGRLSLSGELRIADAASIWRELRRDDRSSAGLLTIDLAGARVVDGGILSLLFALRRELAARGIASEIAGASEHLRPLLHLYHVDDPAKAPREEPVVEAPPSKPLLDVAAVRFVGDIVRALGHAMRAPATVSWSTISRHTERAGIDGVPIVLLLNFLVGFVMAYQSSNQLRAYGANIYVADVVGISATRELVPLMTAIIMAGRSGASFAAELGTMKVTEEIDALRTLGFSPIGYLVLPRMIALTIVAPVLTIAGDFGSVAEAVLRTAEVPVITVH